MSARLLVLLTLFATAAASPPSDAEADAVAPECEVGTTADDSACLNPSLSLIQTGARVARVTAAEGREQDASREKGSAKTETKDEYKERVWLLCLGPKFETRSEDEAASHIDRVNVMQCTQEMTFEELCCAPFAAGLEYSRTVNVDLEDGQDSPAMEESVGLLETGKDETSAIVICTEEAAAAEIAAGEGAAAGKAPMLCLDAEFSASEISGVAEGVEPGQLVLEARIEFLKQQGVPPSSIPTCVATLGQCANGEPPASAGQDVLDTLALAQRVGRRSRGGGLAGRTGGGRGAGGAFLSTTGSFTLSSGG